MLSEARLRPSGAQPGHKGVTGALRRWTLLFSKLSKVICAGSGGGSLQASSDGKGVGCHKGDSGDRDRSSFNCPMRHKCSLSMRVIVLS